MNLEGRGEGERGERGVCELPRPAVASVIVEVLNRGPWEWKGPPGRERAHRRESKGGILGRGAPTVGDDTH